MVINQQYLNLIIDFPPRPIVSEEEFYATPSVINKLLDKPELTTEEEEYLDVLGLLIDDYEEKQDLIPDIYGVELLKVLISENNLKQKDLVFIFKTESIVSEILKGKRQLNKDHIEKLANYFHVSPAVFFPRQTNEQLVLTKS